MLLDAIPLVVILAPSPGLIVVAALCIYVSSNHVGVTVKSGLTIALYRVTIGSFYLLYFT